MFRLVKHYRRNFSLSCLTLDGIATWKKLEFVHLSHTQNVMTNCHRSWLHRRRRLGVFLAIGSGGYLWKGYGRLLRRRSFFFFVCASFVGGGGAARDGDDFNSLESRAPHTAASRNTRSDMYILSLDVKQRIMLLFFFLITSR
jgi:hypothetical protein